MEEQVNIPALYIVWFALRISRLQACFEYMRPVSAGEGKPSGGPDLGKRGA